VGLEYEGTLPYESGTIPTMADLLPRAAPVSCLSAGLFLSRGRGIHETRTVNFHELIVVRRGRLHMQCAGVPLEAAAGEALILPARIRYGGAAPYPADLEFYWIHFLLPPGRSAAPARRIRLRRPAVVEGWCRQLLDDRVGGEGNALCEGLLVTLMLAESHRAGAQPAVAAGARSDLAGRAQAWLLTHLHQAVGTAAVARAMGCHSDYLGRIYRQVHGLTLTADLHRMRLDLAQRLLRETRGPVAAIARECGIGDAAYLRRLFRRRHGMGPQAWRSRLSLGYLNTA
jgi:AraC-like DNA-binding protein